MGGAAFLCGHRVLCYNKEAGMKRVLRGPLRHAIVLVAFVLIGAPTCSWAAFDGSTPMLCAISTIMECDADGECERHSSSDHPDFRFLRVDVKGRKIMAGKNRQTEIKSTMRIDGRLILQGGENGRGWSATIMEESGRLAAGVVADDFTFALFGACTNP